MLEATSLPSSEALTGRAYELSKKLYGTLKLKKVASLFGCAPDAIPETTFEQLHERIILVGAYLIEARARRMKSHQAAARLVAKETHLHDLFHVAVAWEKGGRPVPHFTETADHVGDPITFREEMHALLWGFDGGRAPAFIAFMTPAGTKAWFASYERHFKRKNCNADDHRIAFVRRIVQRIDHGSFESVFNAYQSFAAYTVYHQMQAELVTRGLSGPVLKTKMQEIETTGKAVMSSPDPAFVARARRVFDQYHKDNSAVLVDEFLSMTASLPSPRP